MQVNLLPFSVIVSKKCIPVNDVEWESQLQKHHHETTPSSIEVLDANHSLDLDVSERSVVAVVMKLASKFRWECGLGGVLCISMVLGIVSVLLALCRVHNILVGIHIYHVYFYSRWGNPSSYHFVPSMTNISLVKGSKETVCTVDYSCHVLPQVAVERTSFSRRGLIDDFNGVGERGSPAFAHS
nr:structural maintenance of chromosomes flexible hinge domain-containing protein GMI1 isoform X10 [Ipomoea batatas]